MRLSIVTGCLAAGCIFAPYLLWSQGESMARQRVNELNRQSRQNEEIINSRQKSPEKQAKMDQLILADYQEALRDIEKMRKLTDTLQSELQKNDPHVLNVASLRASEEIEKLSKKIRSRLRLWF